MELLAIAVHSFGTLGKGFDEVMPHNDNEFIVKTIENVEEKLHFLHRLLKIGEKPKKMLAVNVLRT
jgi:hypothetical protein